MKKYKGRCLCTLRVLEFLERLKQEYGGRIKLTLDGKHCRTNESHYRAVRPSQRLRVVLH